MRLTPEQVKDIRRKAKMTQQQMADALGVHVRTVRTWEIKSGARGPVARALAAIEELQ